MIILLKTIMNVPIIIISVIGIFKIFFLHVGKCAEYNIKGAVVQEHTRRDCRSFQNPCPAYYKSDQAYLCK